MQGEDDEVRQVPPSGWYLFPRSARNSYVANAVHLDGAATLHTASLTAPATSTAIYLSMWYKLPAYVAAGVMASDAEDTYSNSFFVSGSHGSVNFAADISPLDFDGLLQAQQQSFWSEDAWHHVLMAGDSSSPDGAIKVYIDGVDVTGSTDTQLPFNMDFNGVSYWALSDPFDGNWIGDIADYFFCSGVNLLVAGDIPAGTLHLFRDANGKPVDPAIAVASLGTPQVLFSGASVAFPTNQGSGGVFTLTGSLTNASTSPSD